jgi:GNAT superfamily N-acetyltransferase
VEIDADFSDLRALRDGRKVTVRCIRPDDAEELRRAFARLSPASRYLRFMTARTDLDDRAIDYLTRVDGKNHFAIVALAESNDLKSETGVGVGRFVRIDGEPTVAEAAVTVADEYQGQGLGTVLLAILSKAAYERGVRVFRGLVLAENRPMRRLLEQTGTSVVRVDDETLRFDVTLPKPVHVESVPPEPTSLLQRLLRAAAEWATVVREGFSLPHP